MGQVQVGQTRHPTLELPWGENCNWHGPGNLAGGPELLDHILVHTIQVKQEWKKQHSGDSDPEESSSSSLPVWQHSRISKWISFSIIQVPFKLLFFHHFSGWESLQASPSIISLPIVGCCIRDGVSVDTVSSFLQPTSMRSSSICSCRCSIIPCLLHEELLYLQALGLVCLWEEVSSGSSCTTILDHLQNVLLSIKCINVILLLKSIM